MTATVRITSVVQGTDRVVVSFVREPAGFRGTLEFPEREPWMRRGVEVGVAVGPDVRALEILWGRDDADDLPTGVLRGSDLVVDP